MENWYAIRVRSNFERMVQAGLQSRGLDEFLPVYRQRVRWSDRTKLADRPLFPGYVFGYFDASRRLPILQIPGVVNILGDAMGPHPVDAGELAAIRRAVESGLPIGPCPFLAVGDQVAIEHGPLSGLRGVLVRLKDQFRVVVSLSLLQRSVAVELDREYLRSVGGEDNRISMSATVRQTAAAKPGYGHI